MQIFSRNPRQRRKGFLSLKSTKSFKQLAAKEKIKPIVVHTPYLLNLASSKDKFYQITIREFILDLREADKLGADYLVTHIGSFKGGTEAGGLLLVINALNKILQSTKGLKTKILLENTSGSGSWLGYAFRHQGLIFEKLISKKRVGLCLDTAHAWAAGYRINQPQGLNELLKEIDQEVGLKYLKVIHLNDTKEELDSRRDRHFDIAKGKIGKKGFKLILNHPKLRGLAFILETPKAKEGDDLRNLNQVRKLYKS